MENSENATNNLMIEDLEKDCTYISTSKSTKEFRIVELTTFGAMYYVLFLLIFLEIIESIIAFTVLKNDKFFKYFLTLPLLPYIIVLLFFTPVKAICKFDYVNRVFSSYMTPIIPIPNMFYSTNVNFHDIGYFYFFKIRKCNKKNFKCGINKIDGEDVDIAIGQDTYLSKQYDPKLIKLPAILKKYLRG